MNVEMTKELIMIMIESGKRKANEILQSLDKEDDDIDYLEEHYKSIGEVLPKVHFLENDDLTNEEKRYIEIDIHENTKRLIDEGI